MDLKNIDLFIFDLDGTLYVGGDIIPGAVETVAALRAVGKKICFLTNNSSRSAAEYLEKLSRMGFAPSGGELCSSALVTIDYLKNAGKRRLVYLLAPEAVRREFRDSGIETVDYGENITLQEPERRDFGEYTVVAAFDTGLVYDNLRTACRLLSGGAGFIATHPDLTCPAPGGSIPDTGSFLRLIAAATGRKPDVICGKPFKAMSDYIIKKYGITDRRRICMVGDRLATDIKFGVKNKFVSVAVLTGETTREALEKSKIKPDFVLQNVNGIKDYV